MANLSGSSPACPRPKSKTGRVWLALFAGCLATISATAALPDYLRTALAGFTPGVPPRWACTITTTRNNNVLVERFDASRPAGQHWTLVKYQGRAPTKDEQEKYRQSRPPGTPVGPQANFQKSDIDPGSLRLISEDAERAEYTGSFRQESSSSDKMLGHLTLHLTVNKQVPYVTKYALSLATPYSPVLGVKMNELQVEALFLPPSGEHPALPSAHSSRFAGRILFIPTEEDLRVTFSDFVRAP